MKPITFWGLCVAGAALIAAAACSAGKVEAPGNAAAATVTPASTSGADFRTTATIKDIMDSVVDPSADYIWDSVSTIVTRKRMPYPDSSGALATAGGIVFTALLDGTILALDDETLEELWSINLGTGIDAAPMTYAVGGKQYIAVATGLTRNQMGKLGNSPEMKDFGKNATMIFVFGL